ncbi:hypothetical protein PFBG_06154, partial [Plasmodium falciparum 7G8]
MTEWAEWFCKAQAEAYGELLRDCGSCKIKGQGCTSSDPKCTPCSNQCNEYRKKIKEWHEQWDKMDMKYLTLYLEVLNTARNGGTHTYSGAVGEKDKPVVAFLQELQEANKSSTSKRPKRSTDGTNTDPTLTSPYSSAAGYIHQELPYTQCEEQKHFCTSVDKENKDKYVFREKPKDHDEACGCKSRPKPEKKTGKKKEEEDPECKTVNDILKGNDGNRKVGDCHPKKNSNGYPDWQCDQQSGLVTEDGICMPPRRQKLCLYYLTQLGDNEKEDKLREAFIKTAAAETFLAWQYYKSKHGNDAHTLDEQLKKGKIPPEFLRSMYYTYGDYRDICLDTDISKKEKDVGTAKTKIDNIFKNGKLDGLSRQEWWKTNGPEIWKGMICALTHGVTNTDNKTKIKTDYSYKELNQSKNGNPSLEEFAAKPQFLRWFIEWGEEFCVERQKKEDTVNSECSGKNATNRCDSGTPCKEACEKYEQYVNKKKNEFNKQNNKFVRNANLKNADQEYNDYKLKEGKGPSKQGNDYLKDKCDNNKCSCMQGNVLSVLPTDKPFGKYAYDKVKKCNCLHGKYSPEELQPPAQQPQGPPVIPAPVVDVCNTVDKLFKDVTTLTNACPTKYGKTAPSSWKCVASGEKSGAGATTATASPLTSPEAGASANSANSVSSAVCIPPRRRKLYIQKLQEWAKNYNTDKSQVDGKAEGGGTGKQSSQLQQQEQQEQQQQQQLQQLQPQSQSTVAVSQTSNGETTLPPSSHLRDADGLRDAFIQSAAVETFFLWHKYKEEKKPPATQNAGAAALPLSLLETSPPSENPQTKLNGGEIPNDFLRLMFYTLGDYRDILYSGSKDAKNGFNYIFSGDKEMEQRESKIQEQLKVFFSNSGNQSSTGTSRGPSSVKTGSNSGKDPASWWNTHGPDIWNGMICALTYKENEEKGKTTITEDGTLKDKLLDTTGKPKNGNDYNSVTLKDESSDTNPQTPSSSGDNTPTTLTNFISRPPYFRYLEEWGETFCKERKKRLDQIYEECKVGENDRKNGNKKCSGYGENCDDQLEDEPTNFKDLWCQDCGKSCSSYRKWIERKKDEFEQQEKIYNEQKTKYQKQSETAKEFCATLNTYSKAGDFLERLKNGPCSKTYNENDNGKDNQEDEINFNDPEQTFKHTKYCDPCSQFKIDCTKAKCTVDEKTVKCKKNGSAYITASDIENGGNSTHKLDMRVSDNGATEFYGLKDCEGKSIFEGIRNEQWKCGNVCGYVVCKPENGNGKNVSGKANSEKQFITIRALLHRWLEYFLEDYNKIKHKISHCINNGEGNICKKDCQNKCNCVEKWVEKKKLEWKEIKNRLVEQYKNTTSSSINFNVKSSLEKFEHRPEFQNAIKPCNGLEKFQNSTDCTVAGSSENGKKRDVVECLLDKLEKEAKKCKSQPSANDCTTTPTAFEDDDDYIPIEENTVEQPNICPTVEEKKEIVDEGKCEAAPTAPKAPEPAPPSSSAEETPVLKPEEEAPTPESPKKEKPSKPKPVAPKPWEITLSTPLKNAMLSSTIMWSIGIGFATFTYFYLK